MPLKFSFKVDPEGMTVPYPPLMDNIRRNRGFIDLRNSPERVREIPEANNSTALRYLLERLASKHSLIFTLGCDLGEHRERTNVPSHRREVAGGYIQFASINYDRVEPQSYAALANKIGKEVNSRAGNDYWKLNCLGRWVNFKFAGEVQGLQPSLWIWFFAASGTQLDAVASRERLIESIDVGVASAAALEPFGR